jgi:preprotein translocase subunit SecA
MRKNLIDYDSILSNQRELVYKQRDQILKNSTNLQIAKNMAKVVAKDVVDMFKSSKNPLFVKGEELANAINKRMFNYSLVLPSFFENKTAAEATNILFNILCISIDKRVELLTPEVANKIFRDIIIQSLDHQ